MTEPLPGDEYRAILCRQYDIRPSLSGQLHTVSTNPPQTQWMEERREEQINVLRAHVKASTVLAFTQASRQ